MAGQLLAALEELVKDVVVGRMADQRVDGNGFSQRGKIAHAMHLLAGAGMSPPGLHADYCRSQAAFVACAIDHRAGTCVLIESLCYSARSAFTGFTDGARREGR